MNNIRNRNFKEFIRGLYTNEVGEVDFEMGARFERFLYDLLCKDVEAFKDLMDLLGVDTWLDDDGEYFNDWIIDWGG